MKLSALLKDLPGVEKPAADFEISNIENDSRKTDSSTLYIAASGYVEDAHVFVESAYANGCRNFLIDDARKPELTAKFPEACFTGAEDIHSSLAAVAARFYGDPSRKMTLVGVTGTKGKTTTTTAIFTALRSMGYGAGMIGTIAYHVNDAVYPATNTTPDLLALNRLMADMAAAGVKYLVMEVSSHALQLGRVEGLHFDVGAMTNFTQDHLDFHKTMDEYFIAKMKFFDLLDGSLKTNKTFVANKDMDRFVELAKYSTKFPGINFKTLSLRDPGADYYSQTERMTPSGSRFVLNGQTLEVSIPGEFNVYNFTLASAVLAELGFKFDDFAPILRNVKVKGRLEPVDMNGKRHVLVDYAHTPDALENMLRTVREMIDAGGRVITVFGAGGDRDRTKRPIMGRAAVEGSDVVVVTSDNPRTEDPNAIIEDILAGVNEALEKRVIASRDEGSAKQPSPSGTREVFVEPDRRKAIRLAVTMSLPNDVVAIAGKGHEDYQIIGKTKTHFSDQEEARNCVNDI